MSQLMHFAALLFTLALVAVQCSDPLSGSENQVAGRAVPQPPDQINWDSVDGGDNADMHSLRLLWPNGGQTFMVGDTMKIIFGVPDDSEDEYGVQVSLSLDGGQSWALLHEDPTSIEVGGLAESHVMLAYPIPDTIPASPEGEAKWLINKKYENVFLRVNDYDGLTWGILDISDASITIEP